MDNVNQVKLRPVISWLEGTALTIGAVLGSGILILPVTAANMAGPASLLSWILMSVLTIPLVITMGFLGANFPDAGGIASYARRAFGDAAGTITGILFLSTVPVSAPIAALIGANYIGALLYFNSLQIVILASAMLLIALLFNYRGINLSGKVQVVIFITVAIMLSIAIVAALPKVEISSFSPFMPKGWIPVGSAMTILFWAFVGWEVIIHLAEEFKNPARDIPISLGISIVVINLFYIAIAFVTVGTSIYLDVFSGAGLAAIIGKVWGSWIGIIAGIIGYLVCYGTIHTYIAGFSRLIYSQACQGDLPKSFSYLHQKFYTPYLAILALAPIFLIILAIYYYFDLDLGFLIQFPSAIFIALYIIGMASAINLLPHVIGKYCAIISLAICIIVYCFTGWAGLYPIGLGIMGWLGLKFKKR